MVTRRVFYAPPALAPFPPPDALHAANNPADMTSAITPDVRLTNFPFTFEVLSIVGSAPCGHPSRLGHHCSCRLSSAALSLIETFSETIATCSRYVTKTSGVKHGSPTARRVR